MEPQYDIYFAGQLLEGQELQQVRAKIGKLFNANEQTLELLFSGKVQAVKRGCDKATALKYKQAMERAGAKPIIKKAAQPSTVSAQTTDKPAAKQVTAAERIAALAAAPSDSPQADTGTEPPARAQQTEKTGVDSGIELAPVGTEVLRPAERAPIVDREVDTSALNLAAVGANMAEPKAPPPPAPDTDHLTMGELGADIPNLAKPPLPDQPVTEGITLSPEGTDFSDCAAPEAEAPVLDLSDIALAEAGADVLEEQYRKHEDAQAPATDHIQLED